MTRYIITETVTYEIDASDLDTAAAMWDYADREHDFYNVDMSNRTVELADDTGKWLRDL